MKKYFPLLFLIHLTFVSNAWSGRESHGLLPGKFICEEASGTNPRVELSMVDGSVATAHLTLSSTHQVSMVCIDRHSLEPNSNKPRLTVVCAETAPASYLVELFESHHGDRKSVV